MFTDDKFSCLCRPSAAELRFVVVRLCVRASASRRMHFPTGLPFDFCFKACNDTKGINKLEGKYSLESTDPRESEILAHLRP